MLTNPLLYNIERIRNAACNAPAMRRGDKDTDAVAILQHILLSAGMSTFRRSIKDGKLDGDYGGETIDAVKRFQGLASRSGWHCDVDGIAGQQVWTAIDAMLGVAVPLPDFNVPLAARPASETPVTTTPAPAPTGQSDSFSLPNGDSLLAAYRQFKSWKTDGRICKSSYSCCAVRMSVALTMTIPGFSMTTLDPEASKNHKAGNCGIDYDHMNNAARLSDHIKRIEKPMVFRLTSAKSRTDALHKMKGVKGIVYFADCFNRKQGTNADGTPKKVTRGNHIDYWDGTWIMNDRMRFNTREEERDVEDSAGNSYRWIEKKTQDFIRFWPLPDRPQQNQATEAINGGMGDLFRWAQSFAK